MTYYIIYKTINKINGRFYIGKHKTKNPNDSYLGSGTSLLLAIKKRGKENFIKEIMEYCKDEEEMNRREREIVTPEFLKENKGICYNMREGGDGGNQENLPQLLSNNDPRKIQWKENKNYPKAIFAGRLG